jgi:hypothetical protein
MLLSLDNDAFVRRRLENISRIERDFMQQVQVTPPDSNEPAPAPIDADDYQFQCS